MSSIKVSLAISVNGRLIPIAPAYKEDSSADSPIIQQFELAAGAIREIAFDTTLGGDSLAFLLVGAVLNSDGATPAAVSIALADAAYSDPAYASWTVIDGLGGGLWETRALSLTGKIYAYNHGSARINVTLIADMEGV